MNCDALDSENVEEMRIELVVSTGNVAVMELKVSLAGGIRD